MTADSGKVLNFDTSADFLLKKADKLIDRGRVIDALPFLRRAIQKDPDYLDCKLALAEMYSEIGRFEESNATLLLALKDIDSPPPECYYGMGYNFMVQNDIERARQNLRHYMEVDPDGAFAEDAEELLDMMDLAYSEFIELLAGADSEGEKLASEGKTLLDAGRIDEAKKKLKAAVEADGSITHAKNNLALACYCSGELERAMELTEDVLDQDCDNIHACCNMAVFMFEKGDRKRMMEYLEHARECAHQSLSEDDLAKLAFTLCELSMHEEAEAELRELLEADPYDVRALFCLAIACVRLNKKAEAIDLLSDINKLSPDDGIAPYYKNAIEAGVKIKLSYVYQVPFREMKHRIERLNKAISLPDATLRAMFETDESFATLLTWGLNLSDVYVKQVVCDLLARVGGARAKSLLQHFVLRRDESDELKNHVFMLLKELGVPEPYTAYIGGEVVGVRVTEREPGDDV